jgi:hypothetical protein
VVLGAEDERCDCKVGGIGGSKGGKIARDSARRRLVNGSEKKKEVW